MSDELTSASHHEMEDLKNNLIMLQVEKMALEITAKIDKIDQRIQMQLERGEQRMNDMEKTLRLKAEHVELLEHRKSIYEQIEDHKRVMKLIADETEFARTLQRRPKLTIFLILIIMAFLISDVRHALANMLGIDTAPIVNVETLDKKIDHRFKGLDDRVLTIETTNNILKDIIRVEKTP